MGDGLDKLVLGSTGNNLIPRESYQMHFVMLSGGDFRDGFK